MSISAAAFARALFPRDEQLDAILRESLLEHRMPTIQVDDSAGRMLQLLATLRKPAVAVEIGTLFGYSAIYLARGLPADSRLISIEVDPSAAAVARRNLANVGVDDRVEVVVGDALEVLATIERSTVGLLFIDGAKEQYPAYLKAAVPLLEPGGLLIADDVLPAVDLTAEAAGHDVAAKGVQAYVKAIARTSAFLSAVLGTESGMLVSVRV